MFELLKKKIESFIGRVEKSAQDKSVEIQPEKTDVPPAKEKAEHIGKDVDLSLATKVKSLLSGKIRLSEGDLEETFWNLQLELLQSDVAAETVDHLMESLKKKLLDREIEKDQVNAYVRGKIREVLLETLTTGNEFNLVGYVQKHEKPVKIVFFGVNGTGKTTTIAKVAHYLMKNNLTCVIAAADTFRAGAIEQAEKHAHAVGVKVIRHQKGSDAAAVVYDAIEHAKSRGIDVVLADTAGRMQTNVNLMDEMKKIIRVNKPDLKIFVGDALTGNDALEQARTFNKEVGIDAVILTKMDADAKGGSALSITYEIKKPIILVGAGQKYENLKEFDKQWFVNSIL
jgi:fused signal recognition particle receptor